MRDSSWSTLRSGIVGGSRLASHNARVEFLNSLATLMGCTQSLGGQLPDGRRPDVLRIDSERGVLFIGDGKHTETPHCVATQARLLGYLRWLKGHVQRPGSTGIFAICFGNPLDADGWAHTLSTLAHEANLPVGRQGFERFDHRLFVVWSVFSS